MVNDLTGNCEVNHGLSTQDKATQTLKTVFTKKDYDIMLSVQSRIGVYIPYDLSYVKIFIEG